VAKERDPATIARRIVDKNLYIAVATADQTGQPWASPVFYAHVGYRDFFWVSEPDATHSRNLRERREVGGVIFDSKAKLNNNDQGVYILGVARELPAHETTEGIQIYSQRSVELGGNQWTVEDVRDPSGHRLYQATAEALYVLDEDDHRIEVPLSDL